MRGQFLSEFDPAYVENVIVPHFLVSTYQGERTDDSRLITPETTPHSIPTNLATP
jgi:hypothetical protein